MIALIQSEVTINHHWLTPQEFTDILAVSQMTPGPVGINTATYTGYTAVLNAGYDTWLAVLGALLASLAVILLPMALMVVAVIFLKRMQGNKDVENIFRYLRKCRQLWPACPHYAICTKFGHLCRSVRLISPPSQPHFANTWCRGAGYCRLRFLALRRDYSLYFVIYLFDGRLVAVLGSVSGGVTC